MPSAMEELSRLRKALRIAAWLRASEITSRAAACGNDNEWAAVMETLRVADPKAFQPGYIPSTDTRGAVCWILDILEDAAKTVAEHRQPAAVPNPEAEYLKWAAKDEDCKEFGI